MGVLGLGLTSSQLHSWSPEIARGASPGELQEDRRPVHRGAQLTEGTWEGGDPVQVAPVQPQLMADA